MKTTLVNLVVGVSLLAGCAVNPANDIENQENKPILVTQPTPGALTSKIEMSAGDRAQIEYPNLNYATEQDYLVLPPLDRVPLVVSMDLAYFTNPVEGEAEILFTLMGPEGQIIQPGTRFFEVPIAIAAHNASGTRVFRDPGNWDGLIRYLSTPDLEGGPSRYELTSLSSSVPPEARYLTAPSGSSGEIALDLPPDAATVTVTLYTFSDFETKSVRALVWHLPISTMPASQQPTPVPTVFPRTISGQDAAALFGNRSGGSFVEKLLEKGPFPLLCPGESYGGFSILSAEILPRVYHLNDFLQAHAPDIYPSREGGVALIHFTDTQEVTFPDVDLFPRGPGSDWIESSRHYALPYRGSYLIGESAQPPASRSMVFLFNLDGETIDPQRALIFAGIQYPDTYLFGRLSCD